MLALLTDRENQIAAMVGRGLSNKQICRELTLMEGTVKIHLHNIYEKLQLRNRTELAIVWMRAQDENAALVILASPTPGRMLP